MGNSIDKDFDGWSAEESHCDTIARDFTYKHYGGSSEKLATPKNKSTSKYSSSRSSRKRSIRNRPSLKARRSSSVKNKLFRSTSKERKAQNTFLLSDMEIQVDGKVAKLVPRSSVVKRRAQTAVDNSDNTSNTKQIKSSKRRGTRTRPKDSMRIAATQQLRDSSSLQLHVAKRDSYEAALSEDNKNVKTKDSNISAIPKHMMENKSPKQNKRWSNLDITPKKDGQGKDRPKSAYININNNNIKPAQSSDLLGVWRIDNSDRKAKKKLSGADMYKDLTSEMGKLALVSPITDV